MPPEQNTGGIPALRGFRKQFLHTLNRILSSETGYFYPESLEDFAVRDSAGRVFQVVQVKDYKTDLTFSELKPFFERAAEYITRYPDVQVVLASYGKLGPELRQYIGAAEATLKKNKKFNTPELLKVFQRLKHFSLNEQKELSSIRNHLTQFPLATGDWQAAFDLLMQELYRGAEQGKGYTRQTLQGRLHQIGQYLAARESYQREWGTSIIPLMEENVDGNESLRNAFHEGVSVKWAHILSGFDIIRPQHLAAIDEGFKKKKIVIVHGASGQGKSALCYRYLHDCCPVASRYEIRDLSTGKRALEVAAALAGYEVPLTFYVDASHNDKGLSEFLQRISEFKHVSCLVSIREEDWRRTAITSVEIQFAEVELCFNREEAQLLYDVWQKEKGSRFPDFEQAWAKFSEQGPLLEFVHLLTHTENLRNRLEKQYELIAEEVECEKRPKKDLDLIRRVAVAGACGAQIDLAKFSGDVTLKQSINRLEKEYLLRRSDDARHVTGLHPVRSEILASIIADPVLYPWEILALECLPVLEDADFEVFLLHIFRCHSEATCSILSYLNTAKYNSWVAANGVLRALLWLGIYEYVNENENIIRKLEEIYGGGWLVVLDFVDFIEALDEPIDFVGLLPEEQRKQASIKIEQWRSGKTPKSRVFIRINNWLQQFSLPAVPSYENEKDWNEFGQTAYWIGFRKINKRIDELLDWNALRQFIEKLPIDTLAVLIYGLWQALSEKESFLAWYNDIRSILLDRYRWETNTPYIEEQDGVIRAHFIAPIDDDAKTSEKSNYSEKEPFHALAMRHVELLAQLVPDCTGYGSQGYGHQILNFEYPYDETKKTNIPERQLKPEWVFYVNKTARILADHMFRPVTWQEYSSQIFAIRKDVVSCLNELRRHLEKHFHSKEVVRSLSTLSSTENWKNLFQQVSKRPPFPLEALDKFGYTDEPLESAPNERQSAIKEEIIISASLQRYKDYLKVTRKYFNGLRNFLDLSSPSMLANAFLGKAETPQSRLGIKQKLQELNVKTGRSFLCSHNLSEIIKFLPQFQSCFRKHFVSLTNQEELALLEEREINTLHSLWPLWFCFETNPSRRMSIPRKTASDQLERRKKSIRDNIAKTLKEASTESVQFNILNDHIECKNNLSLWIGIDGKNLLEVYTQTERLYKVLRSSLGEIKLFSIEHFALDFQWQKIIFVPTCKGKLMESHTWIISINKFIDKLGGDQGLAAYNFIPQQIEPETLEDLGLRVWEPALLNDAKEFFKSYATLQVLLRHLVQLGDYPELDKTGTKIVQLYLDKTIQRKVNEAVHRIRNAPDVLSF